MNEDHISSVNNNSPTACVRESHVIIIGRNAAPTVRKIIRKFEATGSVLNVKKRGLPRSVRTQEDIDLVRGNVTESPRISVSR